jgi:ABC-2 type transport system ATP-binding protein
MEQKQSSNPSDNPHILILDEPTAGLDPKERVRFRNLISTFSKDRIVLLSTHIISDVEYIADDILIMKSDKLLHSGKPDAITAEIDGCCSDEFFTGRNTIPFCKR